MHELIYKTMASSQGKAMLKKKLAVKERIEPFYLGGSVAYSRDGETLYCQFKNHIKILNVGSGKQIGQCGRSDFNNPVVLRCSAVSE